jgi:hypothetical protein
MLIDMYGETYEVTDLKIMHSPAGFYIGREMADGEPFSRESGYYRSKSEAQEHLNNGDFGRDCIESQFAGGLL